MTRPIRLLAAAAAIVTLAGCQAPSPPPADPTGRADAEMTRVLAAYQAMGAQPVSALTVEQARLQPTPGEAAAAVAIETGVPARQRVARVRDIEIAGAAGPLLARVYDPQAAHGTAPIILYFHGGGWVTGTVDTYDASDRALANGTGAIVVSVGYRLAPEHCFPAAHDDADRAYNWLLQNAATLGGDRRLIALAGESAGGNLALDTAMAARDGHLPLPVHLLLIYPLVGTDLATLSYQETADAVPLNRRAILWYFEHATNGPADLKDKRLDVLGAADLRGLPPTTLILAEIDPLRSEGEALAQKLRTSGVPVAARTFPSVTHEFFGMGAVVGQAKQAEEFAADQLRAALEVTPTPAGPRRRARRAAR